MKKKPEVGIVILNWNNYDDTAECINSLDKVEYQEYKIIVVDNGSSDRSGERLQKEFDDYEFVFSEKNRGFAGGCNLGIDHAVENGVDHVLLMNNDITVSPDFLEPLVKTIEHNQRVAAVGSVIYEGKTNIVWDAGGEMRPYIADVTRYKQVKDDEEYPVEFVTCANILLSREFLQSYRLDEFYFFGVEEFDLSWRAKRDRWNLFINPNSEVYHEVGSSTEDMHSGDQFFSSFQKYHNTRGRLYFSSENLKFNYRMAYYIASITLFPLFYLWIGIKHSRMDIIYAHLLAIYDYVTGAEAKKPDDF